jgi:ketosteroid isomerase-like protein
MREGSHATALTVALYLSGCATVGTSRPDQAADREALLKADRDFDAQTAARGIEGWLPAFEDATTQWSHKDLVHGRDHYKETMGPLLSKPGTSLRWQPAWAEVDRDLGYTTGSWQLHSKGADGQDAVVATGHYVTVWRRQPDSSWKAAFDLGNDDR